MGELKDTVGEALFLEDGVGEFGGIEFAPVLG